MDVDRIALCGAMYSGKSTLARELERRGFVYVNFTRELKILLAESLRIVGQKVTVADIEKDKKKYRSLLQAFSQVIGFNDDPKYVHQSLRDWKTDPSRPVVFDNVRTQAQFEALNLYGFKLVKLHIPYETQVTRAAAVGVNIDELSRILEHPIENAIPDGVVDYHTASKLIPVQELADELVAYNRSVARR